MSFDEIARDRILNSIRTTKLDSLPNLKAALLAMRHRVGRVPELWDFHRFESVDPVMLATLTEIGIDRSNQTPTRLTDQLLAQADVVVTLKPGLGITPADSAVLETWQLPEPAQWDLDGIRPLRIHLQSRVTALIDRLTDQVADLTQR